MSDIHPATALRPPVSLARIADWLGVENFICRVGSSRINSSRRERRREFRAVPAHALTIGNMFVTVLKWIETLKYFIELFSGKVVPADMQRS